MNPSPIAREYLRAGRSETCPIIDLHGHLGPFHGTYMPAAPLENMRRELEKCGVKRIVCSHHTAMAYDMDLGNRLLIEVLDAYPGQFLGYWVINPNFPQLIARDLADLEKKQRVVGFKFWPDYHLVPVTSPKYAPALEYANEHELLVLCHTWGESPYDAPAQLAQVAERYPRVQFLMGHSGHGEWDISVAAARDLPNVYLDLTSVPNPNDFSMMPGGSLMPRASLVSPTINGVIEYFVEQAGSSKVVLGSDLPWYSQHYHAGAVLFARISDDARHDILHRNAERLLGKHLRATEAPLR